MTVAAAMRRVYGRSYPRPVRDEAVRRERRGILRDALAIARAVTREG